MLSPDYRLAGVPGPWTLGRALDTSERSVVLSTSNGPLANRRLPHQTGHQFHPLDRLHASLGGLGVDDLRQDECLGGPALPDYRRQEPRQPDITGSQNDLVEHRVELHVRSDDAGPRHREVRAEAAACTGEHDCRIPIVLADLLDPLPQSEELLRVDRIERAGIVEGDDRNRTSELQQHEVLA